VAGRYLGPALTAAGLVEAPPSAYPGGMGIQLDLDEASVAAALEALRGG
jgi:hypothetical protein